MRIFAEDTAALIIDFQEKLVPAIANNEEIVAKAATFVAANRGKFYNPLFIYGDSGIGKTHLLHAIGNYCKTNQNLHCSDELRP